MGRRKKVYIEEEQQSRYKISIGCKNQRQSEFLDLLLEDGKDLCFGIGSAGSGKSYISLAYALKALQENPRFSRIICIVPTCEATTGGELALGFLKGTLQDKLAPYIEADTWTMKKILENSGNREPDQIVADLIKEKQITYELVNFARGRTYDHAIVLINEAEQYSKEEMLLLLTRLGENSQVIITGDLEQIDRQGIKKGKTGSGLIHAIEKLSEMPEVGVTKFLPEDIVRNPLITQIINNWNS